MKEEKERFPALFLLSDPHGDFPSREDYFFIFVRLHDKTAILIEIDGGALSVPHAEKANLFSKNDTFFFQIRKYRSFVFRKHVFDLFQHGKEKVFFFFLIERQSGGNIFDLIGEITLPYVDSDPDNVSNRFHAHADRFGKDTADFFAIEIDIVDPFDAGIKALFRDGTAGGGGYGTRQKSRIKRNLFR